MSIVPDTKVGIATVYWKSPPSELMQLNGVAVSGFRVEVKPAARSQEELLDAGETILQASRRGVVPAIASVVGLPDGSAVRVEFDRVTLASLESNFVRAQIQQLTSVPIVIGEGEQPQPTTRQNDSSPWFGGALFRDPGFNPPGDMTPYLFCSDGFAVVTPAGNGRLLSAGHCDPAGNIAWRDGAGEAFTNGGADVSVSTNDDSMLIDPIGGTGGWVHGGPWDAASSHPRYHLKVAASARAIVNENVCSSGANSGEHCGLVVRDAAIRQWNCGPGTCHGFTARVTGPTWAVTVGGDSGGPVYANHADGRMRARGIIHGGSEDVPCGSVRFAVSNCYGTLWFVDIVTVATAWNVAVETTP